MEQRNANHSTMSAELDNLHNATTPTAKQIREAAQNLLADIREYVAAQRNAERSARRTSV